VYLGENVKCFKRLYRRDKLGYPNILEDNIKIDLKKYDMTKW